MFVSKRNEVVAGVACMMKLLWYHSMPAFFPFVEHDVRGMWGGRIKEKSIISGPIWTRCELERLDVYMALITAPRGWHYQHFTPPPGKVLNQTSCRQRKHSISRSSLNFIHAGVSCGVVQCFMLCYHRTWWRRSGKKKKKRLGNVFLVARERKGKAEKLKRAKSDEREMLCMVVERKILFSRCESVLVASYKVVVTLWYKSAFSITSTTTHILSARSQSTAKTNTSIGWAFSTRSAGREREEFQFFPIFTQKKSIRRGKENFSSVQFSFVCRGISNSNERKQQSFCTSNRKCVAHSV